MWTVDSLKQPKYTGEDRCAPCTVINVGIAVLLAAGVGLFGGFVPGAAGFAIAIGIIYFRGYLVPGTPTLTKRYLPWSILRVLGKRPSTSQTVRTIDTDASTGTLLVAAGALTGDDAPALADSFADDWETAIEAARGAEVGEQELRSLFGTDDVSKHASVGAVVDGTQTVRWVSTTAMAADVAAGRVFAEHVDGWETITPSERVDLFRGLRLFIRSCPSCGGRVDRSERTVEPCCDRPHTLVDVTCSRCGTALAEAAVVGIAEDEPPHLRAIQG